MKNKVTKISTTSPKTSSRVGRLVLVAALALCAGLPPAAAQADAGASAVISKTVDEVLAVLRNQGLSREDRRKGIEEIAYARFDMQTMSRLVLARNWTKFSKVQQDDYIREFKQYLANNYGTRIDRYDQEQVEILGERAEPRGDVTVLTRIVGGEFENATVDYRMRQNSGGWKVIDVTIEGISLVSNYRDQFKEVLSRGGPEELLAKLREKNALGVSDDAL